MASYETYPGADGVGRDHAIVITTVAQSGSQDVELRGPYSEQQALVELDRLAEFGSPSVDVKSSVVLRVSDREVFIVHEGFLSKWTVRAVVGRYVS